MLPNYPDRTTGPVIRNLQPVTRKFNIRGNISHTPNQTTKLKIKQNLPLPLLSLYSRPILSDSIPMYGDQSSEPIIFFLKLTPDLPLWFTDLAQEFNQKGYTLLPVQDEQLIEFARRSTIPVISVASDLTSKDKFEKVFSSRLSTTFNLGHLRLFILSSFRSLDFSINKKRRKSLHFYLLPVEISEIVSKIVFHLSSEDKDQQKWPGGRRMGIPKNVTN